MKTRDWTTVPGWDAAKQEYVELDCEQWIEENKIRELGRENGKQEFPPSEAAQPDEIYAKILAWVNQRGKACHAEVSRYVVQQRHALELETREGMAPIQHTVEGLRDEGIVELNGQAEKDRSILIQSRREAREAGTALAAFKAKANLERVPEYSARDTWYWWLVGIVVIEAVANAMMLAGVHEYGLLGAIVIMLAVGVVNAVILGGMIGEGCRHKNSVELLPKSLGWMILALGATGMFLWNLLVGHFRDSMLAVAAKAASGANSLGELLADDTPERFSNDLFGLEGMLSWLLAVIGSGCCIFAATKWLNRDDVYPGYGDVHRAAADHFEEYQDENVQRRAKLKKVYEEYTERIRDERRQVENRKGNHRLVNDRAREIVRNFTMHLRQYQDHLDFIIAAYRSANEMARKTPNPVFFAERLLIDQEMLDAPGWEEIPPADYDDDWAGFQQAEEAIRTAYLKALVGYPTLEDWMESEVAREGLGK